MHHQPSSIVNHGIINRICVAFTVLLGLIIGSIWSNGGLLAATTQFQQTPVEQQQPGDATEHIEPMEQVVVRIYFETPERLERLRNDIDLWEEALSTQPYVTSSLTMEQVEALRAEGLRLEIDDAQTALLNSEQHYFGHAHRHEDEATAAAMDAIPNFSCYRTVEETYTSLAQLAADHPTLVMWSDVGDSWEKRTPGLPPGYDIFALQLTNSAIPGPKPKLMIIAAIHAREYTTAELATRYAEYLLDNYGTDADVTWLLDYTEIHILPQTNPDGRKIAEGGVFWRKNTNTTNGCLNGTYGVDLNRNSSFQWGGSGSSGNSCSVIYRGPSRASEPEVQTIQTYATNLFADQRGPNVSDAAPPTTEGVFITIHSYSELVLYPWGWSNSPSPNQQQLATLGRKFGFYNGYEICNNCLYIADGTTDDFVYGELGVAAYTFELGTSFFQDCRTFENQIYPDNLPALIYAAKAARRPYQTPSGPDAINLALSTAVVGAGAAVDLTATLDDTRSNSNGHGNEPTQPVQAARYSIDTPSWIPGATVSMMLPADGTFNATREVATATIDTTGLNNGRHTIFVEGQDADGNWGVPTAIFLEIDASAIQLGNCNGDGIVDAGDLSAVVQELFDGDGAGAADVAGGTFAGTLGCDANEDAVIDAADVSCVVQRIFAVSDACAVAVAGE